MAALDYAQGCRRTPQFGTERTGTHHELKGILAALCSRHLLTCRDVRPRKVVSLSGLLQGRPLLPHGASQSIDPSLDGPRECTGAYGSELEDRLRDFVVRRVGRFVGEQFRPSTSAIGCGCKGGRLKFVLA